MTWRGVVFNANNIVGKLFGKGVDVFKYREPNWHMRLCHVQLCWPLGAVVCGCPAETSLKAGTGVWGLALLRPRRRRLLESKNYPSRDLATSAVE